MNNLLASFSTKRLFKPLLIALSISLCILLLICLFASPIVAWFKSFLTIKNPAQLTNFVTTLEYTVDGGESWTALSSGDPICVPYESIKPSDANNTSSEFQLRIHYQGIHKAYLRVQLHGGYVNRHTGTHYSMPEDTKLFSLSTNKHWIVQDDYVYYSNTLGNTNSTASALPVMEIIPIDLESLDASALQEYNTELYVVVDAVQTDRFQELWGIDALPF